MCDCIPPQSSGHDVVSTIWVFSFFDHERNADLGSEGGFFKARLSFPEDFPLNPPKMRFITPMWHPNSASIGLYSNSPKILLCTI